MTASKWARPENIASRRYIVLCRLTREQWLIEGRCGTHWASDYLKRLWSERNACMPVSVRIAHAALKARLGTR